jgi:hypothetical protein
VVVEAVADAVVEEEVVEAPVVVVEAVDFAASILRNRMEPFSIRAATAL